MRIPSKPVCKNAIAWFAGACLLLSAMICLLHLRGNEEPGIVEMANEIAPDLAPVSGTSDGWWTVVQTDLQHREYEASRTEEGVLQAPNRAQNLRTLFGARGITVVPRTGKDVAPAWQFAWETQGFGRPGRMEGVSSSSPSSAGARVVYERNGWSEWYENTAKGLEQGFAIERRPPGEGPLQVVGRVPSGFEARTRADGAIDFLDAHGACVIRYGELHVWDARGEELASELVVADAGIAIVIDDRDATYPLMIDPLMTSPAWTAESDQGSANFGVWVATAGDVNGDGFSDVIVGADRYDNGETDEGRAFVYHGSASGLSLTANWTAEGDQAVASFGRSVATAGDVNGDGFADVIVGANRYDNGEEDEGRAFVYHGSAGGLSPTPNWTAESDQASAQLGRSVATAGDVNGDGFTDVIVGAHVFDNVEDNEGRAFVYHGSAGGLSPTPNWTTEADQAGARFGISTGTAGDVNGDGFADVIVGASFFDNGATDEGRAFVYHGSASGLSSTPNWTAESNQGGALFGESAATAGDVNGDGFADVIVGATSFDNEQGNEGLASIYHGAAGGLSTTPSWTAEGNQVSAFFSASVATAGDVNGDGFADVIVGALIFDNGQIDEGKAFVYHGSAGGVSPAANWTAESDQTSAGFGTWVATAGDVNGDGFADVIVGTSGFDNGQSDEGRAYVYTGAAEGLATTAAWLTEGNQAEAFYGFSAGGAGDVNGDGYSDVVVGAPNYDNGDPNEGRVFLYLGSRAGIATTPDWTVESNSPDAAFGSWAATAGDVNGDGYADVIIGAHSYSNGNLREGAAFVYLGSPAGPATTPAWRVESNQPNANLGFPAATAGDVNGDGYSDVIIGASFYDNDLVDEGRAFVYHGSASGLSPTPDWFAEGDQTTAFFGTWVATAGDVNGDGFSDVIVGAAFFSNGETNEGRAYVYEGSAAGLSTTPAWMAESNQIDARFGVRTESAGDVNGDGFSDVIIGAHRYDNGQNAEGGAFLYEGSAAGLESSPAWTGEGGQPDAEFGISLATAGDVNGDGFSDVVVGAYRYDNGQAAEGRAFAYHGSAAGLSISPAWSVESNNIAAHLGNAVATAGDVNGDGFADVAVGAYRYTNGQGLEGSAFLYYGNAGDGLDRIPRQARTDDTAPISPRGMSDSESGFLIKTLGRTAAGRARVELEVEVKPAGVPFDGTGILTGPATDTGVPGGAAGSVVPLSELANGLLPETLYHWRLRTVTNSPFFPRSPWLWLPDNAATEADVRTGAPTAAVAEGSGSPALGIRLAAPTPNPFTATTQLAYTLSAGGRHRLAVYDVLGREVAVLAEGMGQAGSHTVHWDGRDARGRRLPAGVYFTRLAFDGHVETEKVVLAR